MLKAIASASSTGLIETVFPVPGGRLIAEITVLEVPSESEFEKDKDRIRTQLEALARNDWVGKWAINEMSSKSIKLSKYPS